MNSDGEYFAVFEEWLYPTESGHDFMQEFDTLDEAAEYAKKLCDKERMNFSSATGCDPLPTEPLYVDGDLKRYLITPKNGLEEWWYSARIIEIHHGYGISFLNQKENFNA